MSRGASRKGAVGRAVAIVVVIFASFAGSLFVGEVFFRFYDIGWSALSYEKTRGVVRLGNAGVANIATGRSPSHVGTTTPFLAYHAPTVW